MIGEIFRLGTRTSCTNVWNWVASWVYMQSDSRQLSSQGNPTTFTTERISSQITRVCSSCKKIASEISSKGMFPIIVEKHQWLELAEAFHQCCLQQLRTNSRDIWDEFWKTFRTARICKQRRERWWWRYCLK